MADVQVWSVFAFFHDEEKAGLDWRSDVPEWRLADTIRWAKTRGYDVINLTRLSEGTEYRPGPGPSLAHSHD